MNKTTGHLIEFPYGESGDPRLEREIIAVFVECFSLWCERHRKYGRGNISKFGELGVLIRANDKLERLANLLFHNRGGDAQDEFAEDSWKDMVNYGAIGLLCRRGKWPTPRFGIMRYLKKILSLLGIAMM